MPNAVPRPLRSALFVPAANARALEKSASLPADALIFDLEDSAAPEEKARAREQLARHLAGGAGRAQRVVRVNAAGEPGANEDAAVAALADAVLLPKVESAAALIALDAALDAAGASADLKLWAMIETPRGILAAGEIAGARTSRPLEALVVGPNDIVLATGLRLSPGRPELLPWLMQVVLAAKAHGCAVLDGVFNAFRDEEGFAAECDHGRRLGFSGKTLIHPVQIAPANAAFSPSEEEVQQARAVVAAFADPKNAGRGVVALDGRMVERLHLGEAETLLAFHAQVSGDIA